MSFKYENTKIEKKAIHTLENIIDECDYLDNSFNSMDKELSWDGNIYLYKEKKFSNHTLSKRIPVQIKGHMDQDGKEINKKNIQYQVYLDVLNNYYTDCGVLYFKIVLSEKRREIFYSILYPSKIKTLLEEARRKGNKKSINVTLFKMKKNSEELFRICKQFEYESIKQGSGKGQIVPRSVNFKDLVGSEKITATAIGINNPYDFFKKAAIGDVCFYVNREESDIAYPIQIPKGTTLSMKQTIENTVKIEDDVYYEQYNAIASSDDSIIIELSKNLKIDIIKGEIEIKGNSSLDEFCKDCRFLYKMINNSVLEIGEDKLHYGNFKFDDIFRTELDIYNSIYEICKMTNIKILDNVQNLTKNDNNELVKLSNIYKGKYVFEQDVLYYYNLEILGKVYPLLINKDKEGNISFINRVYESKYQGHIIYDNKHYKVPMFSDMSGEILAKLYKYDYADLYYQIDNSQFNKYTYQTLNNIALCFINAFDITENIKLLDIAEYIFKKLIDNKDNSNEVILNSIQVKKRRNKMTYDDINFLKNLARKTDNTKLFCGIYALLDEKELARKYFYYLDEEEKNNFKKYPIYKYLQ